MPIYDYDGTTTYEIGKVHDYDGTTTHQIGMVHDYDGTVAKLIYTAETVLQGGSISYNYCDTSTHNYTFCTWNLSGINSVPITVTGSAYCVADSIRMFLFLKFADGTTQNLFAYYGGSGYSGGTYNVDLSSYSETQKTSVSVCWQTYIGYSSATNKYNYGNLTVQTVTV